MAKCCICKKVKGKRKCRAFEGAVCSSCCGASRSEATCTGCSFYRTAEVKRRYDKTPHFSMRQMADSMELEDVGNVIEGAMCEFDMDRNQTIKDELYRSVVERLLDRYAFGDQALNFSDDLEEAGFSFVESAINEDLSGLPPERLAKIIGTVYRSIERHANGNYEGRQYIDFIHRHVGIRVAKGARAFISHD